MSDGQSKMTNGYTPLPPDLVGGAQLAVAEMPKPQPVTSPSTSPSPTTSPTTSPSPIPSTSTSPLPPISPLPPPPISPLPTFGSTTAASASPTKTKTPK